MNKQLEHVRHISDRISSTLGEARAPKTGDLTQALDTLDNQVVFLLKKLGELEEEKALADQPCDDTADEMYRQLDLHRAARNRDDIDASNAALSEIIKLSRQETLMPAKTPERAMSPREVQLVVAGQSALDTQVGGDHYKNMAIQPAEYNQKNRLGYMEGSVVKYVSRHRHKHGVQDLEKAKHCIDLLIQMEYGSDD